MYENILVPTDGSEQAAEAIPHALNLAQHYDATVHALCVVNRAATRQLSPTRAETTMEAMSEEAERATKEVEDEMEKAGVECLPVVLEGAPDETILDYVEQNDIDIVVIGGRKRTPAGKLLFGSVTQSVILHADVPVTVVG